MTRIDTRELADQLVAARPGLDEQQQRIAITLYRLLAEGRPVPRAQLAQSTGARPTDVERFFEEQPGIYLDDQTRVVAFWGLALGGMPQRVTVHGRELRTWCAWDTLFLPELLGESATIASTCPTTGALIELAVTPEGIRDISPAGAVLSFVRREQPFDADTIETFCHFVHFFASHEAAGEWTARHPGTFVLSSDDGAEIAPRVNGASFDAVLPAARTRGHGVTPIHEPLAQMSRHP
jgi:alkylmercury lyase